MGYLTNFIVYTLAMVGVIGLALLVFKFSSGTGCKSKSKYLQVIDTMSIGPRKTLYIVSAGEEKFLIAGDVDKTTLISKLNPKQTYEEKISAIASIEKEDFSTCSYKGASTPSYTVPLAKKEDFVDKSGVSLRKNMIQEGLVNDNSYSSVMKKLAAKMQGRV